MENYKIYLCSEYKEQYKVSCNIAFSILEDNNEKMYYVCFVKHLMTYDYIVSNLIKLKYSDDKMQAIINNYLLDSTTDENVVKEFQTMQEWRKLSKVIAKDILSRIS